LTSPLHPNLPVVVPCPHRQCHARAVKRQPPHEPNQAQTTKTSSTQEEAIPENPPTTIKKAVPAPVRSGTRRVKTRLLTVGNEPVIEPSALDNTAPAVPSPSVKFPVGWLILLEGPGRGSCFTLRSGVSQIGRDVDETVSLNFGDLSISRSNHASVAYDPDDHRFYIGHGGKANIVRLNGKPVLSTEQLSDGDIIRVGETSLRLTVLCDNSFNWNDEAQTNSDLLDL